MMVETVRPTLRAIPPRAIGRAGGSFPIRSCDCKAASEPLRLCPEKWLEGSTSKKLVKSLLPLLDLPVERILLAHGDPVLQGGKDVLKALIAPEKG